MRWRRRNGVLALAAGIAVTFVVGFGTRAISDPADANAIGPGTATVTIDIHHSRFRPDRVTVRRGTLVRFVVRNGDPINHELIVGDSDVHDRHATGTEELHPPVPGEVSVGPNRTASTVYSFNDAGSILFACHLPGHFDYGMTGEVRVID